MVNAGLAQLVERLVYTEYVGGSSPSSRTTYGRKDSRILHPVLKVRVRKRYNALCERIGVPPLAYMIALILGFFGVIGCLYLQTQPDLRSWALGSLLPAISPFALAIGCAPLATGDRIETIILGLILPVMAWFLGGGIGMAMFL